MVSLCLSITLPSVGTNSSLNPFFFLHNKDRICSPPSFIRLVSSSKHSTDLHHPDSFTVSYLIDSCGLSPESAISVARKVNFERSDKPDSVLDLLQNHGFTRTQISKLVKKRPSLLLASPEKTLLPKLKFFESIGVSGFDLTKTLSLDPTVLTRSLDNHIIPCYNHLKSVLGSDKRVVAAMKRTSWLFLYDYSKHLLPNIELLREIGVPATCVALLVTNFPEATMQRKEQFLDIIKQVKDMGFDHEKSTFVLAVHAISGGNKLTWDRCYELYSTRWGWSKEEIMKAFKKHPHCMILSEKKLTESMKFLVEEMGWPSNFIATCPHILFFSLEKRIKPRCSVVQVLSKKGLIKDSVSLNTLLVPSEGYFLEKFVNKYLEQVPELLSVYEGEISVSDALDCKGEYVIRRL